MCCFCNGKKYEVIYNVPILIKGGKCKMKVIKRDGRAVDFDRAKIQIAIEKANKEVKPKNRANKEDIKGIVQYIEELNKKISVKGSTPDNGNIEIKNSSVKSYDIGIDGYVVSNGEVKKVSTTKSFKNGTAVYYNPVYGEKCNDYTEANSKTGTKSGCMKWYVFNDKEGNATVNVILDHNTTANVAWNSTGSNSEMKEVKKALENDTSAWKNTARLITANEVAKITGHPTFDASNTGQSWFCLDTNKPDTTSYCAKAQGKSKYAWLFDYTYECTNYGCNTSDLSTWGYWTSTQYVNSIHVWFVSRNGRLDVNSASSTGHGVRPVITISKSDI